MMRARPSRRRPQVIGLAAGVACSLVAVTLVFAQQYSLPDDGTCTWQGWSPSDLGPELQPGEPVTVTMSNSCDGVGTDGTYSRGSSTWIMMRIRTDPLEGNGFTVELGKDRSSFIVTVLDGATTGPRSLWSAHTTSNGELFMTERPFTLGSAVNAESTRGFCCRNQGSPCDAVTTDAGEGSPQQQCGDGNTYVPVGGYFYDEKKDFCDYRICGVPGICYFSNADSPEPAAEWGTYSRAECLEEGGEFHPDWDEAYAAAYAATNGRPYRYYCHPSGAAELMEEFGDVLDGAGVCERVSPSPSGTYFPEDGGGFGYDPPVKPVFDTLTADEVGCAATCGDFSCLYLPVGDTVARGCANLPVPGSDGTTLYPPYLSPLSVTALNGMTVSQAEDIAAYHRTPLRTGAQINAEGAFDTEKLCKSACPPCTGAKCFGIR